MLDEAIIAYSAVEALDPRSNRSYRLIEDSSQISLIDRVDYRFAITNLLKSHSPPQVIDQSYGRCDHENSIE